VSGEKYMVSKIKFKKIHVFENSSSSDALVVVVVVV
jgi:hypothetical protein